jgi:hypothetical protein
MDIGNCLEIEVSSGAVMEQPREQGSKVQDIKGHPREKAHFKNIHTPSIQGISKKCIRLRGL